MTDFFQRDLGTNLLSIFILIGWLGIGFVFLRLLTLSIKKILDLMFKKK